MWEEDGKEYLIFHPKRIEDSSFHSALHMEDMKKYFQNWMADDRGDVMLNKNQVSRRENIWKFHSED